MEPGDERLTGPATWDRYWDKVTLPREHRRDPRSPYLNRILDVFDHHLPRGPLRAIELGGAPGQYLAYLHRSLGYEVHCLDYSARGCEATRENFALLGVSGEVHHADLFADLSALGTYDVVYSLGLIEHFSEQLPVVERHVRLLRPGGHLVLGVPNFLGINGWFMRRLAPSVLAQHEPRAMDLERWREFEEALGLQVVFKGYVGGFEPAIFVRRERRTVRTLLPYAVARGLSLLLSPRLGWLRRLNGRAFSGYAMAVYRLPGDAG